MLFCLILGYCLSYQVGADISLLPSYEDAHATFLDENGKAIPDVLKFSKERGLNYIRCRIFVNPGSSEADVCQSTSYVISWAKRVNAAGLQFMLDFHYSDTWADPGKQTKPSAWRSIAADSLAKQLYTYTKDTLTQFKDAGITIDSIQIGNEITNGMLWNDGRIGVWSESYNTQAQWDRFLAMLTQSAKACREVYPSAKLIVHTEKSGDVETTRRYYDKIKSIDYDVIGLSYYPFWHGTLAMFSDVLKMLAADFSSKQVIIAEVAYCYNQAGIPSDGKYSLPWAASEDGQAQFVKDFSKTIKGYSQVKGAFWWFPEETYSPSKRISGDLHRGLWSNRNGKLLAAFNEWVKLA
jgi:arabinogalactan endo-1,4-beta-galactosidase